MTDLEQLALKCETATTGSRELDAIIAREILPGVANFCDGMKQEYPPYTASLDAAMSLVPEGFCADTQQRRLNTAIFTRSEEAWAQIESIDGATTQSEARAPTVALALTAACLRARAALAKEPTR